MQTMNMKLFLLVLVAVASFSNTSALVTPPSSSSGNSRRSFLSKAPATAAALIVATGAATANPAFANAEEDGEYKFYVAPPEVEKKESGGKLLVGGALFGSVALSLPFFLPNLMRMAGVKNAKTPTATGKNDKKKKKK